MQEAEKMTVICEHCKQPVESKDDLIVMRQWLFLAKPLHKRCWGDLFMGIGGAGSVSYQTGVFQGRRQRHIPINSAMFTIIAAFSLLLAIAVLFLDFSGATTTSGGVARPAGLATQMLLKIVLFIILLIAPVQRLWSYFNIESRISQRAQAEAVKF